MKKEYDSTDNTSIPVEELIAQGTVIICGDPAGKMKLEEADSAYEHISSERELADLYALVQNKFWYIEDELYDYETDTAEYKAHETVVDAWGALMDKLENRIKDILRLEYRDRNEVMPETGRLTLFEPFMARNGYRDGRGWWIKM